MKLFLKSIPTALVTLAYLLGRPSFAGEGGPNLMNNNSFEGIYCYSLPDGGPFAIVNDPANARTGVLSLEAKIQSTGSCSTKYPIFVWPNTSYTTSVWYKGRGALELQVLKHDGSVELAHVDFTATGDAWKQASVTYKTRNFYAIKVAIKEVGGAGKVVYLDDLYTGLTNGKTLNFDPKKLDPKKPAANGLKLLWSDEFDDPNSIDVKTTKGDGYKWYTHRFYNFPTTTPDMYSMKDGVLTLADCPTDFSEALSTAAPFPNEERFVGTVFRAIAPLYFEARFRIHNWEKCGVTKSHSAFWSGDMAMHVGPHQQMLGHPDHSEMVENDFVEMSYMWGEGKASCGIGDWCDAGSIGDASLLNPPAGFDFGQYHTYGNLLVPATAENGWNGYRTVYLDGVPMISTCWVGNQIYHGGFPETFESFASYGLGVIERAWMVIILGSSVRKDNAPTDFDYVRVYGLSESSVKVVKAGVPTLPTAPKNLTALAGDRQVKLVWHPNAKNFAVYRGTSPGGEDAKPIADWIDPESYYDRDVKNGTTYYYKVQALDGAVGRSELSMEVSATPGPNGPDLLPDPGFEEGGKGWTMTKPFSVIKDAKQVHTGSGGLLAAMPPEPSGGSLLQKVAVAKNTNYACGFWMKGQGRLQVKILDQAQTQASPLEIFDAVSTVEGWGYLYNVNPKDPAHLWQKMDLQVFNSGNNTSIYLVISDSLGGGGDVVLDDFYLHALAPRRE
ncbi:MAG TPA: fibronectin type III domain-containing protein [Planctomycetota bacterium]|nr:fibronectin type III domain-containing protein [Planctomycetota bacterium]